MLLRHGRLTWLMLVWCSIFLFSLFASLPRVMAASNPIAISSRTDSITFPKNIDFQVQAQDMAGQITQATIAIMANTSGDLEQHSFAIQPPTQSLAFDWHKDISGNNFLTPGTVITYYWTLQDNAGNTLKGTQQSFTVTDTRFAWQSLSQGKLQVHWYNRSQYFGQSILSRASQDVSNSSKNLGGDLAHPINLWVYQSNDDFHGSIPPDTNEWVGGIAFPSLDEASVVIEDGTSDTIRRDMPHELTHLIFHQLIARGNYAPTWFDEGLAVYNQQYQEPQMALRLKEALLAHTLLHLQDIASDFPADTSKAYLAYAQSWNIVSYMYATFGRSKMAALIRAMNNPQRTFDQDLFSTLGEDQDHLENQWRVHLNQPPLPIVSQPQTLPASTQQNVQVKITPDNNSRLLLLLGILLILLPTFGISGIFALQRRSRNRVRYAQQAQPRMQQPFQRVYYQPSPYPAQGMVGSYPQHYGAQPQPLYGQQPPAHTLYPPQSPAPYARPHDYYQREQGGYAYQVYSSAAPDGRWQYRQQVHSARNEERGYS